MKKSYSAVIIAFASHLCCMTTAFAGVVLDGTMGQSGTLSGPNYSITSNLGQQYGGNLFHSFSTFNLSKGEVAQFSGPASIQNIISRVTGGTASNIDGTIRSSILGANLYLVNPAGVMFGPNASLDVSGSFHASTADYLKLGNDGRFDARAPAQSVLTAAPPSAFGFVSAVPAPITVQGTSSDYAYSTYGRAGLYVAEGKSISLVGGDISVTSSLLDGKTVEPQIIASGGRINLASVASSGEVVIESDKLAMNGFVSLGNITLAGNGHISLEPSTGAAGNLYVRGNNFYMDHFAVGAFSADSNNGGVVDIRINGDLKLSGSSIKASGNQYYKANTVTLDTRAFISSQAANLGTAGSITVDVGTLNIKGGADIDSNANGGGNGGAVTITAKESISIEGYFQDASGTIFKSSIQAGSTGTGNGGTISLTTPALILDNKAGISTQTEGLGNAGTILLDVGTLKVSGDSGIVSDTSNSGNGGLISIAAKESIILDGYSKDVNGNYSSSGIQSAALVGSTGHSGSISLTTPTLTLSNQALVSTQTRSRGDAGAITVNVGTLSLKDVSAISSSTYGAGKAGTITIAATTGVTLDGQREKDNDPGKYYNTGVYSDLNQDSTGNGGNISIQAPVLTLNNFAYISTAVEWDVEKGTAIGTGNAGALALNVGKLNVNGGSTIASSTAGPGNGGVVTINTKESVNIQGYFQKSNGEYAYSEISGTSSGTGKGGSVFISTPRLELWDKGRISVGSSSIGKAGDIIINADNSLKLRDSSITAATTNADGGNIKIDPVLVDLLNSSITATVKGGTGNGGNIDLSGDQIVLNHSNIIANAERGDGGNIKVNSKLFLTSPDSIVTASSRVGVQGTIEIKAPVIDVSSGLVNMPSAFLNLNSLVPKQCATKEEEISSFLVTYGGIPPKPDQTYLSK